RKAATQAPRERTSYTSPRHKPMTTDNSKAASSSASSQPITMHPCGPWPGSQGQDRRLQAQRFGLRCGFLGLGTRRERPQPDPDALALGGLRHVCVGLETGTLELEAHVPGPLRLGKSPPLDNDTLLAIVG